MLESVGERQRELLFNLNMSDKLETMSCNLVTVLIFMIKFKKKNE